MKKSRLLILVLLLIALTTIVSVAVAAQTVARVNGGGKAVFTESVSFPEMVGTVTAYSVAAKVYEDGTATGTFTCVIPGAITILGTIEEGEVVGNQVRVSGPAKFIDKFGGNPPIIVDGTFSVLLKDGGPGVGGFVYTDDVTIADTEVVTHGTINVRIDE